MKKISKRKYELEIMENGEIAVISNMNKVFSFTPTATIVTNFGEEKAELVDFNVFENNLFYRFKGKIFNAQSVKIELLDDYFTIETQLVATKKVLLDDVGLIDMSTNYFEKMYAPRFDWTLGEVLFDTNSKDDLSCQQWLSPPPSCFAGKIRNEWIALGVIAKDGEQNYQGFNYDGTKGTQLFLTYEMHTQVEDFYTLPKLAVVFGSVNNNAAIKKYIELLNSTKTITIEPKEIPTWWKQPIFCGWGQQRLEYRLRHDGSEHGSIFNVGDVATELTYRDYAKQIEKLGLGDIKTITIDYIWAEDEPYAKPNDKKWFDMRKFIDEMHENGKRILLWYTPAVCGQLSIEACATLQGKVVSPDPTSPVYREIMKEQIRLMLSDELGCLNADGFKIDFTQCLPSEKSQFTSYNIDAYSLCDTNEKCHYEPLGENRKELIKTHSNKWGIEYIKESIKLIHECAKIAKADALIETHTANPYFANYVDMLRINDFSGEVDDLAGIMKNRSVIARMCNENWLIDMDNDFMNSKKTWRKCIELQPALGIPCTCYLTGIAQTFEMFDEDDYTLLRNAFKRYKSKV